MHLKVLMVLGYERSIVKFRASSLICSDFTTGLSLNRTKVDLEVDSRGLCCWLGGKKTSQTPWKAEWTV